MKIKKNEKGEDVEKPNFDIKYIYIERVDSHFLIYKGYFDNDEYSILSAGETELEAYKNGMKKLCESYKKISDKLNDITNLITRDYADLIGELEISSEYFETNPKNPCDSGDVRETTKSDAVFYNEKQKVWGFCFR